MNFIDPPFHVKPLPSPSPFTALAGLGPASAAMLQAAGIASVAQLRRLGAVAAYARVKRTHRHASLNLLWALEGALTGRDWRVVAREDRSHLLLALDQHLNPPGPPPTHAPPRVPKPPCSP